MTDQAVPTISQLAFDRLKASSTATVATLLLRRNLRNQWIRGAMPIRPYKDVMVGPAYTLRHIPAREDIDVVEIFRDPSHPQRIAIEHCPAGCILVMDCNQDTDAASGGSILFTRLAVRGVAGVVTDAGLRDAAGIAALDMPAFASGGPCAPTNLVKHHAVDVQVPIGCGGVPVYPGDIIMGDGDGVMVIPIHLVEEVAEAAAAMEAYEAFAIEEIRSGKSVIGIYPASEETLDRYAAYQRGDYVAGSGPVK